jgi:hypothetical protein
MRTTPPNINCVSYEPKGSGCCHAQVKLRWFGLQGCILAYQIDPRIKECAIQVFRRPDGQLDKQENKNDLLTNN